MRDSQPSFNNTDNTGCVAPKSRGEQIYARDLAAA
jgi:hypothetical protein